MKSRFIMLLMALAMVSCSPKEETVVQLADRVFELAAQKYADMAENLPEGMFPRSYGDSLVSAPVKWWCSGFYPGSMWYIYEYTGDEQMKLLADKYTWYIEPIKLHTDDHDVGFQLNCSFGNAYRITGDERYKEPLITGAYSLATRFNPNIGCTQSWSPRRGWIFPVIIDNMMNMELMMVACEFTGDQKLADVANSHSYTTMKNHFRPDYTTYHVVDYDPENGNVRARVTRQGYADDSAWARGQAWALYGYTMMWQKTGNPDYLAQAENVARMILPYLPEDGIPYWDFNDPKIPDTYRDASAGAIMASGFVALSKETKDAELADAVYNMAIRQVRTLAGEEYLAKRGELGGFLLRHSVGDLPGKSEVDVSLTYADYYFLEALIRLTK